MFYACTYYSEKAKPVVKQGRKAKRVSWGDRLVAIDGKERKIIMKKLLLSFIALGLLLFVSNPAFAIYVTPDDLTLGTGLSWDHDQVRPEGSDVTGGAPGFGSSSFYSNVTGSTIGSGVDYTSFRIYADYFTTGITVNDISTINYWTNNTNDSLSDWSVKIYTAPTTGSGWYDTRINFNGPTGTSGVSWEQYDIDSLGISYTRDGGTGVENHSSGQTRATYDSEKIFFIDIIAGYATDSPEVYSYLDGVTITINDNEYYSFDLGTAPVPEPATMLLFGLGILGLAGVSRKKLGVK